MQLSPQTHTAAEVVAALELKPLDQEGGFFRRTAEAGYYVQRDEQTSRAYSVIYALFTPRAFSAIHVLTTDEIWCWHAGDALESLRLSPDGHGKWVRLGLDLTAGDRPQDVVSAGVWQGTRLVAGGRWALVSCTLAPEFRWGDFMLGRRRELSAAYPDFAGAIAELTREDPPTGNR
jgi:uncharacterized protein